jgi:DNA-binding LacI/PurR family transcriptional regulator
MNILDVAAAAGVSTATVSRVLNTGKVSPEARAKVEAAIRQMNYLPNHLARGLITGKTKNIGVIIHGLSNNFSWEFVESVGARLRELDYRLFVVSSLGNQEEFDQEAKYISSFLSQKVDGLILHDPAPQNYESGFFLEVSKRVPLVVVHSFSQVTELNSVVIDQELGMRKVMKFLLAEGHREIWHVRSTGFSQGLKDDVWREELTKAGAPPSEDDVIIIPDGDVELGVLEAEVAVSERLARRSAPSAIFAANDIMAVGTQKALAKAGLRIPEDVSLFGHDNTILSYIGGFSSVDMKRAGVGHATVDLLLSGIEGKDKEVRRVFLTPDLVHRGSTRSRLVS